MSHCRKKSVRDKVIQRCRFIQGETQSIDRVWAIAEVSVVAPTCGVVSFYGLGISQANEWENCSNYFGEGVEELGHCPLFGQLTVLWNCQGASGCVT